MLVRVEGRSIDVRLVQDENAEVCIWVMLLLKTIELIEVHPEKADGPISDTLFCIVTVSIPVHWRKAELPIVEILNGRSTTLISGQSKKENAPISATPSSMMISESAWQEENA